VIYCRVSTKEQVEEGNSLITQERNCREYAIKNGYEIASVFIEQGESAKTSDRTELQKLFAYCANRKNGITAIIAYKIDRISRNTDDYSQIRILLKRYGVEIKSTSEYFENTPAGRFMENIIANVAQFDNDVRAERSIGGMMQAVREGRYVWMAPIGYSNLKSNGKTNLSPNSKASTIKMAFEDVARRTLSVEEVRLKIAKLGITTKNGSPISKSHFYKILRNEVYTGRINKCGERNIGTYEPIISIELFSTVQLVLKNRKRLMPYLIENPDFPLRRFVSYYGTNEKLTGSWSKGRLKKYPYYRFPKAGLMIAKSKLESQFCNFLDRLSFNNDLLLVLKAEMKKNLDKRVKNAENYNFKHFNEKNKLIEKQKLLLTKNLDGIVNDQLFKESMTEIDNELFLIDQINKSKKEISFDLASVFEYLYKFLENPSKIWMDLPFETRLSLQWFVFPNGIFYKNNLFGTTEISFIFKLKETFSTLLYSNVYHSINKSDVQNEQNPLPSSKEGIEEFWDKFYYEVGRFKDLIESPKFKNEEVTNIILSKKDKRGKGDLLK